MYIGYIAESEYSVYSVVQFGGRQFSKPVFTVECTAALVPKSKQTWPCNIVLLQLAT